MFNVLPTKLWASITRGMPAGLVPLVREMSPPISPATPLALPVLTQSRLKPSAWLRTVLVHLPRLVANVSSREVTPGLQPRFTLAGQLVNDGPFGSVTQMVWSQP